MNLHSPLPSVNALRAEIDGIDDALLDLVERRVGLTTTMAALKTDRADDRLKIRPRREAEVVGRLTRRARRAPPALVEHLWRTLMSYGLRDQAPMQVILHAGADRLALQAAVRDRFGPAPEIRWARSERDALDAACVEEAIAVVMREDAPDLHGTPLRTFERLTVGAASAYAIGRVDPADIVKGADA